MLGEIVKVRDGDSWVDIRTLPEYPGYGVSEDGRVWSNKRPPWKVRKTKINHKGYEIVILSVEGRLVTRFVHRLVLEGFVGPRPENMQCLHGPLGKTVNKLSNIRWGTSRENHNDNLERGTTAHGTLHGNSVLTETDVKEIRRRFDLGEKQTELAKEFGIYQGTISKVCLRKTWVRV